MHTHLNLIMLGYKVQCLIAVMASTSIKWLFYQVVNNNAYKHGKQSEELVPWLLNSKQLAYVSKVVTTVVLKYHAKVTSSVCSDSVNIGLHSLLVTQIA